MVIMLNMHQNAVILLFIIIHFVFRFGPLHCFATYSKGNTHIFVSGSEDGCVRIHDLDDNYIATKASEANNVNFKSIFPLHEDNKKDEEKEG